MTDLDLSSNHITLVLLFIGIAIFSLLAIESRKIKSFQFQMSIFIVIWITGEMADLMQDSGMISLIFPSDLGIKIHVLAMMFFCSMILIRFYRARHNDKKLLDDI